MSRRLGIAADPRLAPSLGELAPKWLERRELTNRTAAEDGYRWRKHLDPFFGHLKPDEVDTERIRAFVEAKLDDESESPLAPATIRICISILSSLYEDLLERKITGHNPGRHLPKSLLRLLKSKHDPKTTPFVERLEDVRRIYLALGEPLSVAYAIGAPEFGRDHIPVEQIDLNPGG